MTEADLDRQVDAAERLLPRIMRRVFLAPEAGTPLWDLPLPQLRLLGMLERHGEARMSEVGEKLGVALSTATQIADRLTARGWVCRESDPGDRRVVRLRLTEEGRRLTEARREERRARLRAMLGALEPGERERAVAALELLYQAARTLDAGPEAGSAETGRGLWELLTEHAAGRGGV